MKGSLLHCYSTNNTQLGGSARKFAIKNKDTEDFHKTVSLISSIQGIVSSAISLGSEFACITLDNPSIGDKKLVKKAIINIKYSSINNIKSDELDETCLYQTINRSLSHDIFSIYDDDILGLIIKHTTFLYCSDESDCKKISPILGSNIVLKIIEGFCSRDFKIQIPIGDSTFNVKINTVLNY